jgi:phosphoserine aminotransferase
MKQVHNFSAGPGILPKDVLEQASKACLDFDGLGLSLLEISHRSKNFERVMDASRELVKTLLNVGSDYEVLFLGGGASLQFGMVPLNLLSENGTAAYVNTGVWATKAIKEAQCIGQVDVIASSEAEQFSYIPTGYAIPHTADYLHITSNNTIYGTQFQEFPQCSIPLVCDMSSDIFSRPINASAFDLIYAGAQKNMGPAGCTMVLVKKQVLGKTGRKLLSMLDYQVHIKGGSMYNTPPVFPIYVSYLTLSWLKAQGGIAWIDALNQKKAELLYAEIDRNTLFNGTARNDSRSRMNVCFLLQHQNLESSFDQLCKEAGISGIRGHRDVGGYRASLYNALPVSSVQVLIDVMRHLENQFA